MAGKYVCHKLIPQHRNTHAIMAFIVPLPPEKLVVVTFHVCCCSCFLSKQNNVEKQIFAATSVTGTDARCRDGTSPTSCIGWFGIITIIINIDLVGNIFVRVFFILITQLVCFSFMIVFRVLCGEWIESMWDCIFVSGKACIPYFMATVLVFVMIQVVLVLMMLMVLTVSTLMTRSATWSSSISSLPFCFPASATWVEVNVM